MLSEREVSASIGTTAYGPDGEKLGAVDHYFVDDTTGQPTWVAVTTGLFGTRHSIIPADAARFADGGLHLPFSKAQVKAAPHVADDEHLDPQEEQALRSHYAGGTADRIDDRIDDRVDDGVADRVDERTPGDDTDAADRTVAITRTGAPGAVGPAAHGRHATADERTGERDGLADGAMTRTEEQLRVGSERVATRRARLVKYVVTEEVQVTVPVRREEVRLEYDDVDTGDVGTGDVVGTHSEAARGPAAPGERGSLVEDDAAAGGGLPEEIVLHAERPVVTVEVVPTERVRLRTEEVEGQEQVGARLQREQVVVDQSPAPGRREDRPGV